MKKDDVIAQIAKKKWYKVFSWKRSRCFSQILLCGKKYAVENVIRITSDCPLIDPDIIDLSIDNYERNECEY